MTAFHFKIARNKIKQALNKHTLNIRETYLQEFVLHCHPQYTSTFAADLV